MKVFKYALAPGENEVVMPVGAEILTVVLTIDGPALLALVESNDEVETETRSFLAVGNGQDLPDGVGALNFRGTVKVPGDFTANIFETTGVTASA